MTRIAEKQNVMQYRNQNFKTSIKLKKMLKRTVGLKWYFIEKNELPNDKEKCHFDDINGIMHLGTFCSKDQFGRDNIFVTTEGGHFTLDKVAAWIPIDALHELRLKQLEEGGVIYNVNGLPEQPQG